MSSLASSSEAALTVTVWFVFQVVELKVSDVVESVTSSVPLPSFSVTVTSPVGWVASCTSSVALALSATVSVLPVSALPDSVKPASSLSSTVTATVAFGAVS